MNTDTKKCSFHTYLLCTSLFYLLNINIINAHDSSDSDQYGMNHMGMRQMGMYPMEMGHMGPMGIHNMGPMGMGHMGQGYMNHMGMGYNAYRMLDLSSAQRKQMRDTQNAMHKQNWELREKIMDYSDQLHELYNKDKLDAKAISAVYKRIFDIKLKMIEQHVITKNKMYDVLNKEQREKLKEWKPAYGGHYGPGGRGMRHMMND